MNSARPRSVLALVGIVTVLACGLFPTAARAQSARQIVQEVQRRSDATSQKYEGLLQVFNAKGKISDKRWTLARLGSYGASKMVLRFTLPAEVKGVALLVVNHPDRASDQWMWTPSIERDRRIALQDRSQRFFGTDFSFEDLEERDVEQFDYTLLGDETLGEDLCWKIESVPRKTKSSQYTKSHVWVRKGNHTFARIDNFIKDQVVRRLEYGDVAHVQGIWTARRLEMSDLRTGSRTRLTLDKLEYNVAMKEEDFTLQALRRQ
ncbi:MAG: outer membrane lipoprotein-sorting protein [Vicinamibacterales bacterium]